MKQENPQGRFGTIVGVFIPNVLTIFGIILYLRTGWVTGQAGLINALVIVFLANIITLLTALSLSTIATSMKVKAGGNYYIISRSLGLEVGGAIGLTLYVSQAISVAFYIIGCTEALSSFPIFAQFDPRLISGTIALIFTGLAYLGADFIMKIQYFIFAIIIFSLISFFIGGIGDWHTPTLVANYSEGMNFWKVFAIFFPAVTGISVGVSLSGDLKNPTKSIPKGTIMSVLITSVVYMLVVVWFSLNASPMDLINDPLVMSKISIIPAMIMIGVITATLSSALGSIIAAPRTLEALANDNIVSKTLANKLGSKTEPRLAVLLTGLISLIVIAIGDINIIAPIISMFFLNTYGILNITAFIERIIRNPSFRPTTNLHPLLYVAGALGSYGVMFLIDPKATFVAILATVIIFMFLKRKNIESTWGDIRGGILNTIAHSTLLRLENKVMTVKNWRPNIIVFAKKDTHRKDLIYFVKWLDLGRGFVTFIELIEFDGKKTNLKKLREDNVNKIEKELGDVTEKIFTEVEIVHNIENAFSTVAQAHGIGKMEANTILMGMPSEKPHLERMLTRINNLRNLDKSVVLFKYNETVFRPDENNVLDIWWDGNDKNFELMSMFTHLSLQHRYWKGGKVRIFGLKNGIGEKELKEKITSVTSEFKIDAQVKIIDSKSDKLSNLVVNESKESDLVMIGLKEINYEKGKNHIESLYNMGEKLKALLVVGAN